MHDVSDGGLLVALAEMAMASGIGAVLEARTEIPAHAFWFGEDQARYVVTAKHADEVARRAEAAGVPLTRHRCDRRRCPCRRRRAAAAGRRASSSASRPGCRTMSPAPLNHRPAAAAKASAGSFGDTLAAFSARQRSMPAAADRNAGAERLLCRRRKLRRIASASRGRSIGIGPMARLRALPRRVRCVACRGGGRSAAGNRRQRATAARRQRRSVALQALQRGGAARRHAGAMRHEVGAARGADRALLLRLLVSWTAAATGAGGRRPARRLRSGSAFSGRRSAFAPVQARDAAAGAAGAACTAA